MRIIVDDRERNEDLLREFSREAGVEIEFQRLEVGDYLLPNLVVERKSYRDFCESIKNGRLFRQATQLSRSSKQPLILIEAPKPSVFRNPVPIHAVRGALITLFILFGIPVLKSKNGFESARIMLQVCKQIEAFGLSNHRWRRPRAAKNVKAEKKRMQIHFLQGFPGVGPGKAGELIERFGSIRNIVNLKAEELGSVPGIGRKLVKKIQDLLS